MLRKDNRLDVAAYGEIPNYAHPAWLEQRHQFIQDKILWTPRG